MSLAKNQTNKWRLTVGMEIHVELATATKMFCSCRNDPFAAEPNIHVCPVCYGLPGALPTLNKVAIQKTLQLGQALKGKIPSTTFWARKNYFYPDLPKGYQISQSTAPLVASATLTIGGVEHRIQRIHLEEDAGKLIHQPGSRSSLVNYNRAGVPLLELVTEPDFTSAESAKQFCQELQRVVRTLNISSAYMEKGQMRCEANISVSQTDKLGVKVEVKNINSFRAVEKAINYEFERQSNLLAESQEVTAETRNWDELKNQTIPMRRKETSADYRYFPEPDLPVIELTLEETAGIILPDEQRQKLVKLGLNVGVVQAVIDHGAYDAVIKLEAYGQDVAVAGAKLVLAVGEFLQLSPDQQHQLIVTSQKQGWTKETTTTIIRRLVAEKKNLDEISDEYTQTIDLKKVVTEVVAAHPQPVADYRSGKTSALNFLVGQVMAKTKGRANIAQVQQTLQQILS